MKVEIDVIDGPAKGQRFAFEEPDRFLFGRADDARVSIPGDPFVSRQHFLLEIAPPVCKVTDLDSKNGLFVDGVRYGGRKPAAHGVRQAPGDAKEALLGDGAEIVVGETRMRITIELDVLCSSCGCVVRTSKSSALASADVAPLCEDCEEKARSPQRAETLSFAPPSPPKPELRCERCGEEVSREAGPRALQRGARYVCRTCRHKDRVAPPMDLLEALLKAAVGGGGVPDAPKFEGYRIERELGRGGMGVVYGAVQLDTGRRVAIKTMLPHVAVNEASARSFKREVDVTRQLKHDNIVELYAHGDAGGTFFFVLEFVNGMDLEKLIETKGGRLPLTVVAPILVQTLDGLAYAHGAKLSVELADGRTKRFTGIVHRDLKPQNILLGRDGEGWIPKVADFGLSKSFESAGLTDMTVPGQAAGTPIYWPREQITHYRYLNPATDVFSIAAVFYEALTGSWVRDGFQEMLALCRRRQRRPGIPDFMRVIASNPPVPIRKRNPSVPAPLADVFDRALQEREVPADEEKMRTILSKLRYPDAGAFRDAVLKALKEVGVHV